MNTNKVRRYRRTGYLAVALTTMLAPGGKIITAAVAAAVLLGAVASSPLNQNVTHPDTPKNVPPPVLQEIETSHNTMPLETGNGEMHVVLNDADLGSNKTGAADYADVDLFPPTSLGGEDSDGPQLLAWLPDSANPGTGNPGAGGPSTGGPGIGVPGGPVFSGPSAGGGPGAGGPGAGGPGTRGPGTGGPSTGGPSTGGPSAGGPSAGGPGAGGPGDGGPGSSNPGGPVAGNPGTGEPGSGGPGSDHPGGPFAGNPGGEGPGVIGPVSMGPEEVFPEARKKPHPSEPVTDKTEDGFTDGESILRISALDDESDHSNPPSAIPEPASWALLIIGLLGLNWTRQRKSGV